MAASKFVTALGHIVDRLVPWLGESLFAVVPEVMAMVSIVADVVSLPVAKDLNLARTCFTINEESHSDESGFGCGSLS